MISRMDSLYRYSRIFARVQIQCNFRYSRGDPRTGRHLLTLWGKAAILVSAKEISAIVFTYYVCVGGEKHTHNGYQTWLMEHSSD